VAILALALGDGQMSRAQPTTSQSLDLEPTYRDDVKFLRRHSPIIELQHEQARVAIAPDLQGRVMTSSFAPDGLSLGWVNRPTIAAGEQNVQFNNYGGQDRFWLGPEGGPFTLFHRKGQPQDYSTWIVPDAFNKGGFEVSESNASAVRLQRSMHLVNAQGTMISLDVTRTIRALSRHDAEGMLEVSLPAEVRFVGFVSKNRIRNTGPVALGREHGTVAIWILGMYPGRPSTVVVAPYRDSAAGPKVNTAYYPDQPSSRVVVDREHQAILFHADGDCRSKFGLTAESARDRLGSIDFAHRVLTIILFDCPAEAARYVNCLMSPAQDDPYGGDVLNSYNHFGELRFYELESASPAAFLAPNESIGHAHHTLQFQGTIPALSAIAEKALGVSLQHVHERFLQ
jgi:hypothetical protein